MPELPEVETTVRRLRPRIVGRRIVAFESRWARQVSPNVAAVRRALRGRVIVAVRRRGKYVAMQLEHGHEPHGVTKSNAQARTSPGWLLVHLRMSGRFEWDTPERDAGRGNGARRNGTRRTGPHRDGRPPEPPHVRAVWRFEDGGRLYFCDARKFGRIELAPDLAALDGRLGVEPRSRAFTPERLATILGAAGMAEAPPRRPGSSRSRPRRSVPRHGTAAGAGGGRALKPLLLDQTRIAGLGNIYTDEALHRAGLHPLTPSGRLDESQVRRLHAAIREVLAEGIRRNGASIDWVYPGGTMQETFQVYGRTGQPCRRCGGAIVYLKVAQRGTHICPRCQEEKKATEDTEHSEKDAVGRQGSGRPPGRRPDSDA